MINTYKYTLLSIIIAAIAISCTKTKEVFPTYRGGEPRIVFDKDRDTITNEIGSTIQIPINFIANGITTIVVKKQVDNGVDSTIFNANAANLPSDIFYSYTLKYTNIKADTLDKNIKYSFILTDKAGVSTTQTFNLTALGMDKIMYILNGGGSKTWKVVNANGSTFMARLNTNMTFSYTKFDRYFEDKAVFNLNWKDNSNMDVATHYYTFTYNDKKIIVFLYYIANINTFSPFWYCTVEPLPNDTSVKLNLRKQSIPYDPDPTNSYMILSPQ